MRPKPAPPQARCPNLFDPADDEKLGCRNLIYASRGFPFASESLRQYYYGGSSDWTLAPHPHGTGLAWTRGPRMFHAFEASWLDYPADSLLESYGLADPPERWTPSEPSSEAAGVTPKGAANESDPAPHVRQPPRDGRCGCSVPGEQSPLRWWPIVGLVAFAGRRQRRIRDA